MRALPVNGGNWRRRAAAPARGVGDLARRVRPEAPAVPAWERSVLDDLSARRPWNLRVKLARQLALRRIDTLTPGVTVLVVNWNTKPVTADVVRAVQRLSAPEVRVLVIDNGSTDGSREMFGSWPGISTMLLRSNAGHGLALDLGICASRTTVTVTLDSDAIPLREGWLEPAVEPVRSGRAVLAGLRARRNFVHPVYAAVDTAAFVRRRLSFQTHVPPRGPGVEAVWGTNAWDTGELLTGRLRPDEVAFVERTPNLASGLPGMTTGDVVYHHGGVSRTANGSTTEEAVDQWRTACTRLRAEVEARTRSGGTP